MNTFKDADFYLTAATVIPIVFLGLVLEGGLWKWINETIMTIAGGSRMLRAAVNMLQLLAILILIAGTVGEILALYALWQRKAGPILGDFVFFSVVFLVVLLALTLALRIPGLIFLNLNSLNLGLRDEEELAWSGQAYMYRFFPRVGKLFITDKRIAWIPAVEIGLLSGFQVELFPEDLVRVSTKGDTFWSLLLDSRGYRKLGFYVWQRIFGGAFLPVEIVFNTHAEKICTFLVNARPAEIMTHLEALLPAATNGRPPVAHVDAQAPDPSSPAASPPTEPPDE